jgi:hypothetical protein
MRVWLFLLGIAALFSLAACSPPPELRDDTLLHDESLVSNEPCAAPCWRNITPGETEWNDALTIIEDDTQLENLQTQTDDDSEAIVAEFQESGGSPCCQMFTETGELVNVIFLRLAPDVQLGDVIETHGEPAYAIGSPFAEDQAIVNLLFPEIQTVIYAFVPGTEGEIAEDSPIIGVLYLSPDDMDLLIQTSNLHAWEGFGAYSNYAPENTEFEITPEPTSEGTEEATPEVTSTPEGE